MGLHLNLSNQVASAWINPISVCVDLNKMSKDRFLDNIMKTAVYFGQGFAVC